jgi:DNA-binding MarR family transcriptional regulator
MPLRLVHPVHRATHRIGLYLDDLRERGLTQGEAHILALLAHSGAANVGYLHRGLAHKRSTLTSILDRLTKRGLITRAVGEADRRTFVVRLTAKGRKLARRIRRHLTALERAVIHRVSAADIKGFNRVVTALEDEAHQRCGCRGVRQSPENKKATLQNSTA